MFARSTTVNADPQRIDPAIAHVRDEVMPAVQAMDGCIGLSMTCDRDTGRCIITTSWESEEAMAASRERVKEMRERGGDVLGTRDMTVEEWEVAAMHRARPAGDGAMARLTYSRARDLGQLDRLLDAWKMTIPAKLDEMDGFCSVSLMVDRATGRAVGTATFTDRAALESSRERVRTMREEFTRAMPVEITEVAEMELALAHLHVPEMV